jgi:integrase
VQHSTKVKKPAKPYPDFPLYPHRNGQWAKTICTKECYFGSWKTGTWQEAYEKFKQDAPSLFAGNVPEPRYDCATIGDMVNRFLHFAKLKVQSGRLRSRTWTEYEGYGKMLIEVIGRDFPLSAVGPATFEHIYEHLTTIHKSPASLDGDIGKVLVFFNYANQQQLTDRPIRPGPLFKRSTRADKRKLRAQQRGRKFFEAWEIRQMLDEATPRLRAMILLGINCGFGNMDCATLPISAVDLDDGWIDYTRAKTGVQRRCPLWPETVAALRNVLACRKPPKDPQAAPLVFATKKGNSYGPKSKDESDSPIAQIMGQLLRRLKLERARRGFYSLRHTFYTIGRQRNKLGAQIIMGHADADEAASFASHISDEWYDQQGVRGLDKMLREVSEHVHDWLFTRSAAPVAVVGEGQGVVAVPTTIESPATS